MALNIDPVFHLDEVKRVDALIDHKVKDLRRTPKPKNDTDTTNTTNTKEGDEFNLDDIKNFDPSKFDPSKFGPDMK